MQALDPVRLVAIVFGLLLVLTRLPAVFNPGKFKGFISKLVKKNVKLVGGLCLLIGGVSLYFIWPQVPLMDLLAVSFAVFMLGYGLVCLVIKEVPLAFADILLKKSNPFIRYAAFFKVLIGLAILYYALPPL